MADSSETKSSGAAERNVASPEAGVRIPLHDPVPTLFADGCHAANVIAGCVRLDLFVQHAWAGAKDPQQMVVGRVVLPLERFEAFARGVNAVLTKLKEDTAAKKAAAAKV